MYGAIATDATPAPVVPTPTRRRQLLWVLPVAVALVALREAAMPLTVNTRGSFAALSNSTVSAEPVAATASSFLDTFRGSGTFRGGGSDSRTLEA